MSTRRTPTTTPTNHPSRLHKPSAARSGSTTTIQESARKTQNSIRYRTVFTKRPPHVGRVCGPHGRLRARPRSSSNAELVESPIEPAGRKQGRMVSPLYDPSLAQHQDEIGASDRRQAVGDHQHRASAHEAPHGLLHQALRLCIEGAGGLVENEDGTV